MHRPTIHLLAACGLALTALTATLRADESKPAAASNSAPQWSSFITPQELHARLQRANLLIIDVRSPPEYAAGHIPGAINLPGVDWRTPPAAPGSGKLGQQIFRRPDGSVDVPRYEKFLGDAGLKQDHEVVIYGNHAGKADGSLPAALLLKLGHPKVAFLDGVGLEQWKTAGYAVATEPTKLAAATYKADADPKRLWSYDDVRKNLKNPNVVILDSRTPEEFAGNDLRGNKRGGHIPGARLLNSDDFIEQGSLLTIAPELARKKVESILPDKDKTVVIYCQSGTRCSLKELVLKDLGYKNVVLYDASWQEWGNKEDAPVEK